MTDSDGFHAHRCGAVWCYDHVPGGHDKAAQVTEPELLRFHGTVTEVLAAVNA